MAARTEVLGRKYRTEHNQRWRQRPTVRGHECWDSQWWDSIGDNVVMVSGGDCCVVDDESGHHRVLFGYVLMCKWNPGRKGPTLWVGLLARYFDFMSNLVIPLQSMLLPICHVRHLAVSPLLLGSHEYVSALTILRTLPKRSSKIF